MKDTTRIAIDVDMMLVRLNHCISTLVMSYDEEVKIESLTDAFDTINKIKKRNQEV